MYKFNVTASQENVKNDPKLTFKVHPSGVITVGYNHTVPSSVEPYLGVKFPKSLLYKGYKGHHLDPDLQIKNALSFLQWLSVRHVPLAWLTFTFNKSDNNAIKNIAKKIKNIREDLTCFYDKNNWANIWVFGIQEKSSFHHEIPCYDINLVIFNDFDFNGLNNRFCNTIRKRIGLNSKLVINTRLKTFNFAHDFNQKVIGYIGNNVCNGKNIELSSKKWGYNTLKTRYIIPSMLKEFSQPCIASIDNFDFAQFKKAITSLETDLGRKFEQTKDDKQGLVFYCKDMKNFWYLDLMVRLKDSIRITRNY